METGKVLVKIQVIAGIVYITMSYRTSDRCIFSSVILWRSPLLNQGVRSQGNVESTEMRIPTFIHRRYKLWNITPKNCKKLLFFLITIGSIQNMQMDHIRDERLSPRSDPAVCMVWCIMIVGRWNRKVESRLLSSEWATLCQSSLATSWLTWNCSARSADDNGLGVWENCCDVEASWALDVHEEWSWCWNKHLFEV